MYVIDKYDEMICEMKTLKNVQAEIEKKTRALQARLVDPGISVHKAYSAYKFLDCEIDVLWDKARKFEAFCETLQKTDKDILDGVLSRTNMFILADTLGVTTGVIYSRLGVIFKKYEEFTKCEVKCD